MGKSNTQQIVLVAIVGAISFILMFVGFPVIPALPFLKVDFSIVPLLLIAFVYGPKGAIGASFIANFLHYMYTGGEMGIPIGDTTAFIATIAYILPIYYILKDQMLAAYTNDGREANISHGKTITAYVISILSLTIVMTVLNYFVITPFYMQVMNFDVGNMQTYLLAGIIPFNLIKGVLVSLLAHFVLVQTLPTMIHRFGSPQLSRQ
ncbi:ECF transporter S component [Aerococcus sp. 1KP-2016]|uniref:ECF transporter S component n=1 Tax=Aerococcus sp. 1KP-2016 TaxID=1981982 RepID=UPI000B98AE50|nr:ECF transporter S component [Aerococcus sp. 1KP-2016]OYQ67061.1 ECF transporter S component [Aerococcus sp. 1KP-2016]